VKELAALVPFGVAANTGRGLMLAVALPLSLCGQTDVSLEFVGQWLSLDQGTVYRVTVNGNYAYLATGTTLEIIDVADPANPHRVGGYSTVGTPWGVRVIGTNAFLATSGGLQILDVSDPTTPRLLGTATNSYMQDLEVSGNYAYVNSLSAGFQVYDLVDLTSPTLVTNLNLSIPLSAIRLRDGLAYCSSFYPQLLIVNVEQPTRPVRLTNCPAGDLDVDLAGDFAFVSDSLSGFRVIRISDPAHPAPVAVWPAPNTIVGSRASGAHAFVVDLSGGIYAVDISNPTHPTQVGFHNAAAFAHDIDIAGPHAYIAAEEGLIILRIETPNLQQALDDPNLLWTMSSSSAPNPWRPQTSVTHDGIDAAEGGPIQAGLVASFVMLRTAVVGPGAIRFWWRLENSQCFRFRFFIDSVPTATFPPRLPGLEFWELGEVSVPAGAHDLRWRFETICGDGSPAGRAWLDQVSFNSIWLSIVSHDATSVVVQVTGPAGYTLQLETSNNLASWTRDGMETVTLGGTPALVQIPRTEARAFYRAVVLNP
jgi:hypothetical protein